jgi:hypothetical protein
VTADGSRDESMGLVPQLAVGQARTKPPRPPDGSWPIAWYPIALPVAYISATWSGSVIHPAWLFRPIAVTVLIVLIVTALLSLLIGNRHRGGLAASALGLAMLLTNTAARTLLLILVAVIVGEGLLHRGRPWRTGHRITKFMSTLAAALLLVAVLAAMQSGSLQNGVAEIQADLAARHAVAFNPEAPDIYVILLDGYPGDDAATLDPSFDSNAFPAALNARGFDVQRHARSNYLITRLTVPTMFANQHVLDAPELDPPLGNAAADARRLRIFGDGGVVLRALRDAGYETITAASPAAHLGLRQVDRVMDPPGPSEFEQVLLMATGVGRALDDAAPDLFASISRDQILYTYASAAAVSAESHARPRFVWIHVLAPHPPFLFHGDGTPTTNAAVLQTPPRDMSDLAARRSRITETFDYALFISTKTLELLDRMLASVQRESVILVFSDHGTETGFDPMNPPASDLNERTSIVLALRSPGHPNLLPPGTTPIGVLPRVLNTYVGTSLPIRADTTWGWPRNGSLLDAIPIDLRTVSQ